MKLSWGETIFRSKGAAQMRLAMKSLLNRAWVVHEVNLADEEDGGVELIGIKINYPEVYKGAESG